MNKTSNDTSAITQSGTLTKPSMASRVTPDNLTLRLECDGMAGERERIEVVAVFVFEEIVSSPSGSSRVSNWPSSSVEIERHSVEIF